jgi:hypothetical protein
MVTPGAEAGACEPAARELASTPPSDPLLAESTRGPIATIMAANDTADAPVATTRLGDQECSHRLMLSPSDSLQWRSSTGS